jgi:hypothetical protein
MKDNEEGDVTYIGFEKVCVILFGKPDHSGYSIVSRKMILK